MVGVISISTPTSRYWNWVLTSELTTAVAAPVWNDPVATGIREPTFKSAFWPSVARTWGFCSTRVSLSVYRRLAVAWLMVTPKLVAFRCARSLIVKVPVVVPVVVVPLVVVVLLVLVVVVVVVLGCSATLAVWGRM